MKKLIALTAKLSTIVLFVAILLSLASCIMPFEAERQRIFKEIDKIEKSSNYAILSDERYVTQNEEIYFEKIIKERIQNDGHKTEDECKFHFCRYRDVITFTCLYNRENRFFGLNNSNNHYAFGTIAAKDFSIEIHYMTNKYELMYAWLSETQFLIRVYDEDAKKQYNENGNEIINCDYYLLNRKDGEIEFFDDYDAYKKIAGEEIEHYANPTTFVYKGEQYTIFNGSNIYNEKGGFVIGSDDLFNYSDVLMFSPELQEVNKILGEGNEYAIDSYFFTNGEDLFIGFVSEEDMFGYSCDLTCPVIFKTDLNLNSFEYIGCVSSKYTDDFYSRIEVKKID